MVPEAWNSKKRNNKEKNDWKNIGEGNWREYLSPTIELLENKGAASGIMAKHPKILKMPYKYLTIIQ